MCDDCWNEAGKPAIWNEQVAKAVALITSIYTVAPTGGPLHVELDDWNVDGRATPSEDEAFWIEWNEEGGANVWRWATELADLLNSMPEAERYSALAFHWGFASPPVSPGR